MSPKSLHFNKGNGFVLRSTCLNVPLFQLRCALHFDNSEDLRIGLQTVGNRENINS